MIKVQEIISAMLAEIERGRSGEISLEELEERLWRLLDRAGTSFPPILAGQVEEFVLELKKLRGQNRALGAGSDFDEDRGFDQVYNEVIGSLSRLLD